jgi:hypothetical protein
VHVHEDLEAMISSGREVGVVLIDRDLADHGFEVEAGIRGDSRRSLTSRVGLGT